MKKVIIFIVSLLLFFLPYLIKVDYTFSNSLTRPFFTPPNIFFIVCWSIVYISLCISITMILSDYTYKTVPKSYLRILLINYFFNVLFRFVFFTLKSTFLGFIFSLGTFITCLILYEKTTKIKEQAVKFLNPYVLLSLFGTVLSFCIYVINL